MISIKLAQSVCAQHTKFKEGGNIQSPIKTNPNESPSTPGTSPKLMKRKYCWFFWLKVKKPGFYPLTCSPRLQPPGKTSTGGKSDTRVAYGEEIVPDEFPSFGRLYWGLTFQNESDPESWDRTLVDAMPQCQATLIAPSWAITGSKKRKVNIILSYHGHSTSTKRFLTLVVLFCVLIFPAPVLDSAKHCMSIPLERVLLIGRHLDNGIIEDGEQQQIQLQGQAYFAPDVPGSG